MGDENTTAKYLANNERGIRGGIGSLSLNDCLNLLQSFVQFMGE